MPAVPTVLVVDDNAPSRRATARVLERAGYKIAQAATGLAALSRIRALQPGLVVLDIIQRDGGWRFELLRQIRADPALHAVMVVVVGSEGIMGQQEAACLQAGADAYLARPIANDELVARVHTYIRHSEINRRLHVSEEQFSAAFAYASVGMALVAADGRFLKVNRALCQMLGYSEAELLATTFREITHPEDLDDRGHLQQLLAGARPSFQLEKRYRHGAGHWVVGLLNVSLVRDGFGQPLHQVAQIQNVTAWRDAEDESRRGARELRQQGKELAAEKARLVAAQAISKVGSWETDVKSGCVSWSEETHRIFETDPASFEPSHHAVMQLVHPDDRLIVDQAFVRSQGAREPSMIEHRLRMTDGRIKIVEERWQILYDEQGRPVRAVGTCQDITERRRADAMMRASEARYHTLFDYAPDGILISDAAGRNLDANATICRLLGYERHELLRLSRTDVVVREKRSAGETGSGPDAAHADYDGERTLRRKDGSPLAVEILCTPMPDGNLLDMIRDITVRKAHEREILRLSRLYAALSQVNHAIATTQTRGDLFNKVCRALVEFGGFPLAWIGWVDAETRRVIPMGQWGEPSHYITAINVFADDRPEGRGPVGTAIREGKHSVSNDFANDPRTLPWREIAEGAHIRAVASFPIRENGAVVGAMTVYSREAGLFQDKEIMLLQEAAGDVGIGIDNLNRDAARRQAETDLRATQGQLHALIGRMHTVREEEAKRIARELHDDLGQKLTGLNMELDGLGRKLSHPTTAELNQLEKMRTVVDHTIEVVQKISGELRLSQLDLLGLTAAVEWHSQEFARHAGIACRVTHLDETPGLSDIQRTTVFRILQEALTNIARHAGATEVVVSLQALADELVLTVNDNGRGITAAELRDQKSIGLLGMRERALLVGGDVTITGAARAGTTVRVRIPLILPDALPQ
ncbi:MAG TPA: PAS domain S-box protein [Opitutaceae bacterium]|nr:PAS domain S-box protein [Opitutaceae bacterium]